jgi:DNA repair protein RecN (Recombination protein N)
LLRDLGAMLVEIHGQHDDRGLINPRGHRALLDSFARADTAGVAKAHGAMREADAALEAAIAALDTASRDREWLDHAVEELRAFAPEAGEEEILAERRAAMQRGERVAADLGDVVDIIEGSDGALSKLRQAARALDRIAREHPSLSEALAAIDRALIEGTVAEEQLREAARLLVYDAAVLEADETRLFDMRALARKHRVQPDDLAALTLQRLNSMRLRRVTQD